MTTFDPNRLREIDFVPVFDMYVETEEDTRRIVAMRPQLIGFVIGVEGRVVSELMSMN